MLDGLISLWKAARRGERTAVIRHQASLDGFFRNVRRGLDARREGLERWRGSRFALLRWSHDLRRSLASAASPTTLVPAGRSPSWTTCARWFGTALIPLDGHDAWVYLHLRNVLVDAHQASLGSENAAEREKNLFDDGHLHPKTAALCAVVAAILDRESPE